MLNRIPHPAVMEPSPCGRGSKRAAPAFTLAELLVTLPILLIVLSAAAVVVSNVRDAVSMGQATGETLGTAQAMHKALRDDFARLSKEGFMVIKANGSTPIETDQITFFSLGPWTSTQSNTQADIARVWYGHVDISASDAWKWPLGRHALLISPTTVSGGINAANNIWHDTGTVASFTALAPGYADICTTDMLTVRQSVVNTASPTPPGYNGNPTWTSATAATRMAAACFRVYGKTAIAPGSLSSDLPLTRSVLAANCSQFKVEYSADGITWTRPSAATPFTVGYGTGGTDGAGTWPKLIRITAVIHDSLGRLHDRYQNTVTSSASTVSDGVQVQFVLGVP